MLTAAKEKFVVLRKKWGIKNQYTIQDIAQKSGLPVQFLKNRPANFEGYMDWNPTPRFIAVNGDLPAHQQAWFIARQLAVWAQEQRFDSLALNRPWKWQILDAAPEQLRSAICRMDVAYRAHWLMLFWAAGDDFRAFIKANPKRFWSHLFTDNIVRYHLSKLRVKLWFAKSFRKIAFPLFPAA
jgi:hypothetical protein